MTGTPGHKKLDEAQAAYLTKVKDAEKAAVEMMPALNSGDRTGLLREQEAKNRALIEALPSGVDHELADEAAEYLTSATNPKDPARVRSHLRIGYMLLTRAATNPGNAL